MGGIDSRHEHSEALGAAGSRGIQVGGALVGPRPAAARWRGTSNRRGSCHRGAGRRACPARLPPPVGWSPAGALSISLAWLREAVAVAPIDAEASVGNARAGTLWCLLPGPEHREVVPERLDLVARENVKIACGDSTVSLSKEGTVRVRGKDVTTRGSRVARLQGGTVRIN